MNSLDIFGKFKDRQNASSVLGGVTSVIALVCVIILVSIHVSRLKSENLHRELKIDFHKVDQHVQSDIDILLFNAPCDIVSLGYKDILGEDVHDIHVTKMYLDKNGSPDDAPAYQWDQVVTADTVDARMKNYPGCRLLGKFNSMMKVKGIVYVSFGDHSSLFNQLNQMPGNTINLEYQIKKFSFGDTQNNQRILDILKPYHEDIHYEMNPFIAEQPHRDGKFIAYLYMQVFPFEVIDDTRKESYNSHQYSYIRNYKEVSTLQGEAPSINIQVEFLPIISVYHIKVLPRFKTVVGILGACGGMFSIFAILTAILSTFAPASANDNMM